MSIRWFSILTLQFVFISQCFGDEFTLEQKNRSFMKDGKKIVMFQIKVGDIIHFSNQDNVTHNIFSLSQPQPFDLGPFKKGERRTRVFSKVGKKEVECAIHPEMFIEVNVKD